MKHKIINLLHFYNEYKNSCEFAVKATNNQRHFIKIREPVVE